MKRISSIVLFSLSLAIAPLTIAWSEQAYPPYTLTVTLNGSPLPPMLGNADQAVPQVAVGVEYQMHVTATNRAGESIDITTSPQLEVYDDDKAVTYQNGLMTATFVPPRHARHQTLMVVFKGLPHAEDAQGYAQCAIDIVQ